MKKGYWYILVGVVLIVAIGSFAFAFRPGKTEPSFLSMPFVLWSGILLTIVLVLCTFIGSLIFPFKEDKRS